MNVAKTPYAEYVAREAGSDAPHAFIDGEVAPIGGGTPEHEHSARDTP